MQIVYLVDGRSRLRPHDLHHLGAYQEGTRVTVTSLGERNSA